LQKNFKYLPGIIIVINNGKHSNYIAVAKVKQSHHRRLRLPDLKKIGT